MEKVNSWFFDRIIDVYIIDYVENLGYLHDLLEIIIFSINNAMVRPNKIIQGADKKKSFLGNKVIVSKILAQLEQ